MIRENVPCEAIAQTIKQFSGGQTIFDTYLGAFVNPEIMCEIESFLNQRTI